jgi:putative Mg2+ transporter-C (MgtC) family protein
MTTPYAPILAHLLVAVLAGGLIGFERSFHGRPAGFRTHTLVCLASAVLMVGAVYQSLWFTVAPIESLRIDPTRMAQGIMTGIGFLGAGVILKEGFSVRGLTTAASIWITAAIGILAGVGFYFATAVAVALTLGTLAGFRWIETRMPRRYFAQLSVQFARRDAMAWPELRELITQHGFSIANVGYKLDEAEQMLEYRMGARASESGSARRLAQALLALPAVKGFDIVPTAD